MNKGDVFKTKKNGLYYEITTVGQSLISAKRLDKKGFLHLTFGLFEKEVDVLYTEKKEIKEIKNSLAEEKLKKENINIKEFSEMDINERMKILDKKKISYTEQVDLVKYDYTEVRQQIKATMPEAVRLWEKGRKGIFRCTDAMIKLNKDMQDIVNEIKHCCFCKGIEGDMIQKRNEKENSFEIGKIYYAHPACLEKAQKQVDEARKNSILV